MMVELLTDNQINFCFGRTECLELFKAHLTQAAFEMTQLGSCQLYGFRKADETKVLISLEAISTNETRANISIINNTRQSNKFKKQAMLSVW